MMKFPNSNSSNFILRNIIREWLGSLVKQSFTEFLPHIY